MSNFLVIRMHLLCPHCGKAHILRDDALGVCGRNVRCSSCKSTWFADAPGKEITVGMPAYNSSSQAVIEQVRKAAAYKPLKSKKLLQAQQALGSSVDPGFAVLAMLVVFLILGLFFREAIVKTSPNFALLYKAIGLPVNIRGFEFADIQSRRDIQNGGNVLIVEGKIINTGPIEASVPRVRVILRTPAGVQIEASTVLPAGSTLEGAGETTFKTVLVNPSPEAKDILVHFSDPQNLGS
jgi:predicted Zn finger-like uncharacterized protein